MAWLTATNEAGRFVGLTNMFRAVGQVMHLLEDTSQPQHVRNEQHVYPFTNWLRHLDPWTSPIEKYGADHVKQLNYQHAHTGLERSWFYKLKIFGTGIFTMEAGSHWMRLKNGGEQLGLAEWCNGNFLGARHLFPEYFKPGNIEYYPYPSRDHSTDYSDVKSNPIHGVHNFTNDAGVVGERNLPYKNRRRNQIYLYCSHQLLGSKNSRFDRRAYCTIDDPNVEKDYHGAFIPKAVEYSAGLLNYYFRGTISAAITDYNTNTMQYTVSIQNTSSDDFHGGTFLSTSRTPAASGLWRRMPI